uniref:Uncharacterized protein n=1 Tax=Leersia perrieri TaxID=77586 RepID=A0A0D9XDQ6_9ORYZ
MYAPETWIAVHHFFRHLSPGFRPIDVATACGGPDRDAPCAVMASVQLCELGEMVGYRWRKLDQETHTFDGIVVVGVDEVS